jgi:cobalt-zinc-cadmium efflux system outer membrane protein
MTIWNTSRFRRTCIVLTGLLCLGYRASAQQALTWAQVKDRFEKSNPTLQSARANIDESRAAEVTAYLRPNPDATFIYDQFNFFTTQPALSGNGNVYNPTLYALPSAAFGYLHERQNKRELRRDTARKSTDVTIAAYADQERMLMFNLRNAFVQVLTSKAVVQNANENLDYWNRELSINQARFDAGDMSREDLDRLKLQRLQFQMDLENALVNVRTNKIQLLMLMNDRTPVEQFDVSGDFDFNNELMPLQQFRDAAMDTRPDLKEAVQNVELAKLNHKLAIANGSVDPTFGLDIARNPPIPFYVGFNVNIPLRIFDRNQGEKARTLVDVTVKQRSQEAAQAQVLNDVDSAYATIQSNLNLLRTRPDYLQLATEVRDREAFAYRNGGATLIDVLETEKSYRDTRLAYINLVGTYLTASAQMNLAVGREILQ